MPSGNKTRILEVYQILDSRDGRNRPASSRWFQLLRWYPLFRAKRKLRNHWVPAALQHRHDLTRRCLFFANRGEFRTGNLDEIMNKASCLSLLSNAVLVWNTVRIAEIVDCLRASGQEVLDTDLARPGPTLLPRAHIIPTGTYSFEPEMPGGRRHGTQYASVNLRTDATGGPFGNKPRSSHHNCIVRASIGGHTKGCVNKGFRQRFLNGAEKRTLCSVISGPVYQFGFHL